MLIRAEIPQIKYAAAKLMVNSLCGGKNQFYFINFHSRSVAPFFSKYFVSDELAMPLWSIEWITQIVKRMDSAFEVYKKKD